MAKTTTIPIAQSYNSIAQTLVAADSFTATQPGTAPTNATKILYTAGAEGSNIKALTLATDATAAAQTVALWMSPDGGTTKNLLCVINVPLNSGYTGAIANVDALSLAIFTGLSFDAAGKPQLVLKPNAILYVSCMLTAVAASKTIWITGHGEDF